MRRRLTLTLTLLACLMAVTPAAYASWRYSTRTVNGATTASRSSSGACSLRTYYTTSLRFACSGTGSATATYKFQLPSNVAGRPGASLVPTFGPYTSSVRVVGSTAYVTVKVTSGSYRLRWVNLVYYVR